MSNLSPYAHAQMIQRRIDESNGIKPLPTVDDFIKQCGVSSAQPESIIAMSGLVREALCVRDDLTNDKKYLLNQTLRKLTTLNTGNNTL